PAQADDALVGKLGAAEGGVAVDERHAGAGADIRRDGRSRSEVIQQVRQDAELADLVADRTAGEADTVLIVAIDAFELDPGTDEVVADHAARREAGLGSDGGAQ